jgi:hypothetical protein
MQPDAKDAGYLLDMLEHARGVMRAVQDRSVTEYLADEDFRLAIERRIEIIGKRRSVYQRVSRAPIPRSLGARLSRSGMSLLTSMERCRRRLSGGSPPEAFPT